MREHLAFSLTMTVVFLAMGVWLAVFPKSYLRAVIRYTSVQQSFVTAKEVESLWWQLAIRALGCCLLAAAAVFTYATFGQPLQR